LTYSIKKEDEQFHIIERATNLTVKKYDCEKKAKDVKRGLNLGKGFAGFTPTFFTQEFEVDEVV
jgi:hypothetical protein